MQKAKAWPTIPCHAAAAAGFTYMETLCTGMITVKAYETGRCGVGTICNACTFVLFCFLGLLSPPFPINWVVLSTGPQIDYLIWFWKFWSTLARGLPGADDVVIFPIQIVDECKVRLDFRLYLEEMAMSFIFLATIRIHHGKLYILFFTFMRSFKFFLKKNPLKHG